MLQASSAFGPGGAATHYGILESGGASAAVVQWTALRSMPSVFGDPTNKERTWTMTADLFNKDTGDPIAVGDRNKTCIDTLISVIESDDTLQGTVTRVTALRANRELPPDGIFTAGGAAWFRMPVEIDCVEWPSG